MKTAIFSVPIAHIPDLEHYLPVVADLFILTGTGGVFDEVRTHADFFQLPVSETILETDSNAAWYMGASGILKRADHVILIWDAEDKRLKRIETLCKLKYIPCTVIWTKPKQWYPDRTESDD